MALPLVGHTFGQELAKALGLEGRLIRRIILDCEVNNVVKVYIEEFVETKCKVALLELLSRHDKKETDLGVCSVVVENQVKVTPDDPNIVPANKPC